SAPSSPRGPARRATPRSAAALPGMCWASVRSPRSPGRRKVSCSACAHNSFRFRGGELFDTDWRRVAGTRYSLHQAKIEQGVRSMTKSFSADHLWLGRGNPAALAALRCARLPAPAARAADVTFERLLNPEPGNWLMNHHDFSAQRFSKLDAINKSNVKNLKLAFAVALGGTSPNE